MSTTNTSNITTPTFSTFLTIEQINVLLHTVQHLDSFIIKLVDQLSALETKLKQLDQRIDVLETHVLKNIRMDIEELEDRSEVFERDLEGLLSERRRRGEFEARECEYKACK